MKGNMNTKSNFNYDKDMLFAEFKQASEKDAKNKTNNSTEGNAQTLAVAVHFLHPTS